METAFERSMNFSADGAPIQRAGDLAAAGKRGLDDEFPDLPAIDVSSAGEARPRFREVLDSLPKVSLPRRYTRDEMNERG